MKKGIAVMLVLLACYGIYQADRHARAEDYRIHLIQISDDYLSREEEYMVTWNHWARRKMPQALARIKYERRLHWLHEKYGKHLY